MKFVVAKKEEYRCADCKGPITAGAECLPVNEYGEKVRLHRACADKRSSAGTHGVGTANKSTVSGRYGA